MGQLSIIFPASRTTPAAQGDFVDKVNWPKLPNWSAARRPCAIAIAGAAAAILFRLAIGSARFEDIAFLTPFVAIIVSAIVGGWGAGLLTMGMILLGERELGHWHRLAADPRTSLLVEGGLLLSLVGGRLFSTRRSARAADLERLELERRVLEIGDEERSRIGRDLHDGLGQHLAGISLLSASLAKRVESASPTSADDAAKISELIAQTIGWTRELARGLSPMTLETDGLFAAVEELAATARSFLNVDCTVEFNSELNGGEPELSYQASLHLFRIVQEAVSNSIKHGKARTVKISLRCDGETLTAQVIDDGCGLSEKTKANPGLGLRIMSYRTRMLGATLKVERAAPEGGTIMVCRCPL